MDYPNALAEEFDKYFEILRADSPELMKQIYRLRYQVYCLESRIPGFEKSDFPDEEEKDKYDLNALHGMLFHRSSGRVAGTVRLVLPNASDPMWIFPIEAYAGDLRRYIDLAPQRAKVAEISRFILSGQFRRREGERDLPDGLSGDELYPHDERNDRRHIPHPVLGLIKSCVKLSWEHDILFWCAGMEPRLQRRLSRFGMGLTEVCDSIQYHGNVNLYFSYIPDVLRRCYENDRDIWTFLTEGGQMFPLFAKSGEKNGINQGPNQRTSGVDETEVPADVRSS